MTFAAALTAAVAALLAVLALGIEAVPGRRRIVRPRAATQADAATLPDLLELGDTARSAVVAALWAGGPLLACCAAAAALGAGAAIAGPAVLGLAVGWTAPRLALRWAVRARAASMARALPERLDLVVMALGAGLPLDAALHAAARQGAAADAGSDALAVLVAELRLLPDRAAAWRNFARRTHVPLGRAWAETCREAELAGAPIAAALGRLAARARGDALAEAERRAASLPARLALPLVAFFLPALLALVVGPAVLAWSRVL